MDKLQTIFDEIISLQPKWDNFQTSKERNASEEMTRRRELCVNLGPSVLNEYINKKLIGQNNKYSNWESEGSNGVTNSAEIPWIRIFIKDYSHSPQYGFYITLLFNALGNGVYLTLNQASTQGSNSFKKLEPEIVSQRVSWAKKIIGDEFLNAREYKKIDLEGRRTELGNAYAATDIVSFLYENGNIPEDESIIEDINFLLTGLESLYAEIDNGSVIPGEFEESQEQLIESVGKTEAKPKKPQTKRGGQGTGLSKKAQTAVEIHAMNITTQHYKDLGWKVKDKSKAYGEGHDLEINREGEKRFIEVKGSTTPRVLNVFLSPRQVELSQKKPDQCILAVVENIQLNKKTLECKGGNLRETHPWKAEDKDLKPMKYTYKVPNNN